MLIETDRMVTGGLVVRFEEAFGGWQQGAINARLLGVCERTFRRYIDRYGDEGLDGLIDKRLKHLSHRRAPVDEVVRLVDCYRTPDNSICCQS